jgi:hypothetical protein
MFASQNGPLFNFRTSTYIPQYKFRLKIENHVIPFYNHTFELNFDRANSYYVTMYLGISSGSPAP